MAVNKVQSRARALGVATKAGKDPVFVGFPYEVLIALLIELIPLIVECFRPVDGHAAKRMVEEHWDANKAGDSCCGYDHSLVFRVADNATKSARKQGIILTRAQAHALAVRTLDDVRLGDAEQTSAVVLEHIDWSFT